MSIELIIAVVVVLGLIFYLISIYNKLVSLKNRVDNGWAQIDVQLQRRYDLIPNLVETAKGYMKHEKDTLKMVIDARNSANDAAKAASSNPSDQNAIKDLQASEQKLQGAMMSFQALAESYPDLKANQNMLQLQEEMTSTENKIAFARQAFNDSVTSYNNKRETFPSNIIAGAFGFKDKSLYEVSEEKREKVAVKF